MGLEHQGQTSISDPDQNLGFICIFSSGMQENTIHLLLDLGAPITQLGERQTLDRKVAGSILILDMGCP